MELEVHWPSIPKCGPQIASFPDFVGFSSMFPQYEALMSLLVKIELKVSGAGAAVE